MRVNLVGNFAPNTGLTQDAMIIRGLLQIANENVRIRKVPHYSPECSEAELNVFLEVINPALFASASKNIWIPNTEWTSKNWIPYMSMIDEIWVKTKEAETLFLEYTPNVKYIGWTSIDKGYTSKKNYSKAIVLVGKNMYRHPKPILKSYFEIFKTNQRLYKLLPDLYIPHSKDVTVFCPPELDKVHLMETLKEDEYNNLLQECGLAICISGAEGFGHAVNEAMSAGCNVLLSAIKPFFELTSHGIFTEAMNVLEHPSALGVIVETSSASITEALTHYVNMEFKIKKLMTSNLRTEYETRHTSFMDKMKSLIVEIPEFSMKFMPETDLPDISIITVTKDRRIFMPLAKYSYLIQSYPEDKLEWIIVDDGESIEDTLMGIPNVKYIRTEPKTIGEKRNIGVENAMYDTIVMMDDDDVYPNNSALHRVAMLNLEPKKDCVFCTTIPCYDICNYSSFVNVPPNTLKMSERLSEATLGFTRKFWEERKFPEKQIAEGDAFVDGREQMCREISPQEVIVSLVHSKNTSSRRIPEIKEPNGCHFGFKEELFALVSEIGQDLIANAEKTLASAT
jgi:hypothetical protein